MNRWLFALALGFGIPAFVAVGVALMWLLAGMGLA